MRIARSAVLVQSLLALTGACSPEGSHSSVPQAPTETTSDPSDTTNSPDSKTFDNTPMTLPPVAIGNSPPQLLVPTDTRAPRIADKPPVSITGGTLIATADGKYAVAADPDRNRVSVVDIVAGTLTRTIELKAGDEPGRLVEDDSGRVHVALRRGGAVASIALATGEVIDRRAVCATPRGIAFDAAARALRVACASGELVTLPVDGGSPSERLQLGSDLRDVLVDDSGVQVTRFKRAELLRLAAGASDVQTRTQPQALQASFAEVMTGALVADTLEPEVAWRTVSDGHGGSVMLHQGARQGEIALGKQGGGEGDAGVSNPVAVPIPGGGAYGGGGQCDGVVQTELTHMDANGKPLSTVRVDAVLAVDVAVAPISHVVAIVQAGERDPEQPVPSFGGGMFATDGGGSGNGNVIAFDLSNQPEPNEKQPCAIPSAGGWITGQPTAVAFRKDDTLLVQTREPAAVTIVHSFISPAGVQVDDDGGLPSEWARVDLGGVSVYDTGHELFHRDAGAHIACASCHAEGGDDGHVWHFANVGPRRTQSVNVGLEGTAPFHWSGDQPTVAALMEDVFVTRMGGVHESEERANALQAWLFAQSPLPAQRAANDAAAVRGKALFEGVAECANCHNGARFTNNTTVDVGTGEALQVPSLRGIGYRAPLIHNGCAAALRDRFDPACGGKLHGKTAQLSDAQIDDVIAYLQTL